MSKIVNQTAKVKAFIDATGAEIVAKVRKDVESRTSALKASIDKKVARWLREESGATERVEAHLAMLTDRIERVSEMDGRGNRKPRSAAQRRAQAATMKRLWATKAFREKQAAGLAAFWKKGPAASKSAKPAKAAPKPKRKTAPKPKAAVEPPAPTPATVPETPATT